MNTLSNKSVNTKQDTIALVSSIELSCKKRLLVQFSSLLSDRMKHQIAILPMPTV